MTRDGVLDWVGSQVSKGFAGAIAGMAGKSPAVGFTASNALPSPEPGWLWWRQPYSGVNDASITIGAPESAWQNIGEKALAGLGLEDASLVDCRGTYLELLQQALSALGAALSGALGREVLPNGGAESTGPTPGASSGRIELIFIEGEPACVLSLHISPDLPDAVATPVARASPEAGEMPVSASDTAERYELLLDVEMPVSVSFGRAHLPLREVVKLTSGAIVELNRAVSEPVELIVNNCVIARGEVVVVDGNYGVRIKQIISRRERLRTLH